MIPAIPQIRRALLGVLFALSPIAAGLYAQDDASPTTPTLALEQQTTPVEAPPPVEEQTEPPPPTPTPEPVITYVPPLSLNECLTLIERTIQTLPPNSQTNVDPATLPVRSLQRMIRSCFNYLQFRDDLHTSLSHYRWIELDDTKVTNEPDGIDVDILTLDPPARQISAISLESLHGDVWLHLLRVYDSNGVLRGEFLADGQPRLLRHSLPRLQVFHLWRRTDVCEIHLHLSLATTRFPERPRVVVWGGTTDRPEHIKTAIFHLGNAREHLANHEWPATRSELLEARRRILSYLEENKE